MTATPKPILPLAVVPVASNDDLPTGTLTMSDIRQRLGIRKTRMVKVETKRPRKVHHMDVAEAAFFPRLFWGMYLSFDQADQGNAAIIQGLRSDMQLYGDLMAPSQWHDFKREMDNGAMVAMEAMIDRQIGNGGGWNAIKVFMVSFLLIKWVDRHAAQAMFTTDFACIAQDILTHLDELYGDECDGVEPSAHKMLPKVITRLKACGLFLWLPDYRSENDV
ncbi:hypothetical protein [Paremcibacter congregatus]|uniref:hypothetical protein n=1 Tax=Paremcibacter congregatus TaxID=2043170 RepID=UPI003A948DAB